MIDFKQFHGIIPENGSLTMIMTRQNGHVLVTFAPKYKDADKSQELAPIPLQGTPEELTEFFNADIKDLAALYEKVANLPKPAATAKSRLSDKKQELTKKIEKTNTTAGANKEPAAGPLFEAASTRKTQEQSPVISQTPEKPEEPEEDFF
jgi:PRTRC genetic system protein E